MFLLRLSCTLVVTVLVAQSPVLEAAPLDSEGSGTPQVDHETIKRDLIGGIQVSLSYSYVSILIHVKCGPFAFNYRFFAANIHVFSCILTRQHNESH